MANELVVIEKSKALDVFKSSNSVEDIISKIESEVNSFVNDVNTDKGRKEIKSLAYRVAQSKTYLDGLGKDLVAELKEIPKLIDANRKTVRDRLDALRDKVRQPLTEWETEQDRIKAEQQMLAWHEEALEMNADFDKALAERIESDHEIALLMNEKFDRDLAQAKAEAERQRIAHEEELKKQAAEQARLAAEQKHSKKSKRQHSANVKQRKPPNVQSVKSRKPFNVQSKKRKKPRKRLSAKNKQLSKLSARKLLKLNKRDWQKKNVNVRKMRSVKKIKNIAASTTKKHYKH